MLRWFLDRYDAGTVNPVPAILYVRCSDEQQYYHKKTDRPECVTGETGGGDLLEQPNGFTHDVDPRYG